MNSRRAPGHLFPMLERQSLCWWRIGLEEMCFSKKKLKQVVITRWRNRRESQIKFGNGVPESYEACQSQWEEDGIWLGRITLVWFSVSVLIEKLKCRFPRSTGQDLSGNCPERHAGACGSLFRIIFWSRKLKYQMFRSKTPRIALLILVLDVHPIFRFLV